MTALPPIDDRLADVLAEEAGAPTCHHANGTTHTLTRDDDAPTVQTALGIIDDARALVDGLADHVLPTLRHGTDDHLAREALLTAGEKVAAAWAALVVARTVLEDLR